jgi:hypothetical protein
LIAWIFRFDVHCPMMPGEFLMSQTILNLAQTIVTEKIDELLAGYPLYPHQRIFASPDLRQRLTAYVLSRIPGFYVTVDRTAVCTIDSPLDCYSPEEHQHIDSLIHEGISHLLSRYQVDADRYFPKPTGLTEVDFVEITEVVCEPSSWFG